MIRTIINFRVSKKSKDKTTKDTLEDDIRTSHEDLKALFIFHNDLITSGYFTLTAAVVTKGEEKYLPKKICKACLHWILCVDKIENGKFTKWMDVSAKGH